FRSCSAPRPSRYRPLFWGCLALLMVSGCAGSSSSTQATFPSEPTWTLDQFAAHLSIFNAPGAEGRATGTSGFARAGVYAANEMRQAGLQPAAGPDFRSTYPLMRHEALGTAIQAANGDTLTLAQGYDYLQDGRSDSLTLTVSRVLFGQDPSIVLQAPRPDRQVVALPWAPLADTTLHALRDAGTQLVLLVGPPRPVPAQRPTTGLAILHIRPRTLTSSQSWRQSTLDALLAAHQPTARALPVPLSVQIRSATTPMATGLNLMGFLPGKDPVRRERLVVICADLDATGLVAGIPTVAPTHLGTGAAAVLEVAKHYGRLSRFSTLPGETLLFALWSGGWQDQAGLRAYLERPLWPLDQTSTLIYVGQDPAAAAAVRAHVEAAGVTVFTPLVTLEEAPDLQPWAVPLVRPVADGLAPPQAPPPRLSVLTEAARADAAELAEAILRLLAVDSVVPPTPPPRNPPEAGQ
ncbi:MAG: hypothetical protein AAGI71_06030, partial [Bacteroidota bacterium]